MVTSSPELKINPPLLNSANPWATSLEDLAQLFHCPSTGAVTTRTALLKGFDHDPAIHQYAFFDPGAHDANADESTRNASLNTLGYSPIALDDYLSFIKTISDGLSTTSEKLVIISVTGTPEEVAECYRRIAAFSRSVKMPLAVEVNLSCPNIPSKPPPAYSGESLALYLTALGDIIAAGGTAPEAEDKEEGPLPRLPYGLKTPPYTYADQFRQLVSALRTAAAAEAQGGNDTALCPVSFLTATNTLGSCLVLSGPDCGTGDPRLPGLGIGGMAGAPLHPLALGNVATLRRMLDEAEGTRGVKIIGIGGVEDAAGYRRMKGVGAFAVGVGTALGRRGLGIFEDIEKGLGAVW